MQADLARLRQQEIMHIRTDGEILKDQQKQLSAQVDVQNGKHNMEMEKKMQEIKNTINDALSQFIGPQLDSIRVALDTLYKTRNK